jgi:hypothetical protein
MRSPSQIAVSYLIHKKAWENKGQKPFTLRQFVRHELKVGSRGHRSPSSELAEKWTNLVQKELDEIHEDDKPAKEPVSPEKNLEPKLEKSPQWMIKDALGVCSQRHDFMLSDP